MSKEKMCSKIVKWKKNQKDSNNFGHKNWLGKSDFGTFWEILTTDKKEFSFEYVDFCKESTETYFMWADSYK